MLKTSGGENETEYVLPFQISREQCAELYKAHAKKVRYLPKDFKNPEHLESFTGIYMPYYEYDVEMGQSHITGTKTVERRARYEVVNTYRIDAAANVYTSEQEHKEIFHQFIKTRRSSIGIG